MKLKIKNYLFLLAEIKKVPVAGSVIIVGSGLIIVSKADKAGIMACGVGISNP